MKNEEYLEIGIFFSVNRNGVKYSKRLLIDSPGIMPDDELVRERVDTALRSMRFDIEFREGATPHD